MTVPRRHRFPRGTGEVPRCAGGASPCAIFKSDKVQKWARQAKAAACQEQAPASSGSPVYCEAISPPSVRICLDQAAMNLVLSFRITGYFRNINCLLGDSQQLANPNQGELGSCDDGGEFVVSCPLVRTIQIPGRRHEDRKSALPPKADIRQRIEHVCFLPNPETKYAAGTGSCHLLDVRQLPSQKWS